MELNVISILDEFMQHAGDLCPVIDAKQLKNCLREINGLYCRSDVIHGSGKWYAGKPSAAEKNANLVVPKDSEQVVRRRSANAVQPRTNESMHSDLASDQNNNIVHLNCSTSTKTNTSNGKLSAKSNNTSFR